MLLTLAALYALAAAAFYAHVVRHAPWEDGTPRPAPSRRPHALPRRRPAH